MLAHALGLPLILTRTLLLVSFTGRDSFFRTLTLPAWCRSCDTILLVFMINRFIYA